MTRTLVARVLVPAWALIVLGAGSVSGQDATPPLPPCQTTAPVQAQAPPDPDADPVSGWWHISEDRKLWVRSPPPGEPAVGGIGRYWVRPAGQPLRVTARRLDAEAPPVVMEEREARYGFFFGGPAMSDGCWNVTATSGSSEVTWSRST